MRQRDVWREILSVDEATIAVQQLVKVWNLLAKSQPEHIKNSVTEPKLTERLCNYLRNLDSGSGLTGRWSYEDPEALYDAAGNVQGRIRKDITYFSNASNRRLFLIFEFKKLRRTSIRNYEGRNGMRRFADGQYAYKEPLAAMVGMLNSKDRTTVGSLYRSLSNKRVRGQLCMVHDANLQYICRPSKVFPGISHAAFDTEHRRPTEYAPPGGTTTLVHLFIEFP